MRNTSLAIVASLALLLLPPATGNASAPDLLVLGMDGGVAVYNSVTSETHAFVDVGKRSWEGSLVAEAVIGVDVSSTVTLWVLSEGKRLGLIHPLR